ncbi:hypothetical protein [Mycobacterium gastri]|uniref:hypothetical protein n=1 Tax=Mycobacterium gastri TaxID=1777 RepID=UPI00111C06A1|nr:hypothetical protein [Mycobacterium gastri]
MTAVHDVLVHTAGVIGGRAAAPEWPLPDIDSVDQQLGGLIQARIFARQTLLAPRRWGVRERAQRAERQTVCVALFAGSALHLVRVVTSPDDVGGQLSQPVCAAIDDLATGAAVAEADPAVAAAHAAAARRCAADLASVARNTKEIVLADVVRACADDLQQVIDLRQK